MANLSKCLRYYISERLNNDPGWKNIKVHTCSKCHRGIFGLIIIIIMIIIIII